MAELHDAPSDDPFARDPASMDRAFASLYVELKAVAHRKLAGNRRHGLSTTALVHETWLKIARGRKCEVEDRRHFFNLAARAMRQVLLDHVEAAQAAKRPADEACVTLDETLLGDGMAHSLPALSSDLLDLERALSQLEHVDARLGELATLRLFAGLEFAEIAGLSGRSERTVLRDWRKARAILATALETPAP